MNLLLAPPTSDDSEDYSVIAGENAFSKLVELDVTGQFNTIKTIVLTEDEWNKFINKGVTV